MENSTLIDEYKHLCVLNGWIDEALVHWLKMLKSV